MKVKVSEKNYRNRNQKGNFWNLNQVINNNHFEYSIGSILGPKKVTKKKFFEQISNFDPSEALARRW